MTDRGVFHVLLVCTANRCRSPIAAALLRQRLPARSGIEISSAGLLPGGGAVPPEGLARLRRFGIDLSGHVSRQVTPADTDAADLVLAMTRGHLRQLIEQDDELWPRCFTIKDFVRRGENVRQAGTVVTAPALVQAVAKDRGSAGITGESAEDDVIDPMGRSTRVWTAVVRELAELAEQLAVLLAPPPAPGFGPAPALQEQRRQ